MVCFSGEGVEGRSRAVVPFLGTTDETQRRSHWQPPRSVQEWMSRERDGVPWLGTLRPALLGTPPPPFPCALDFVHCLFPGFVGMGGQQLLERGRCPSFGLCMQWQVVPSCPVTDGSLGCSLSPTPARGRNCWGQTCSDIRSSHPPDPSAPFLLC